MGGGLGPILGGARDRHALYVCGNAHAKPVNLENCPWPDRAVFRTNGVSLTYYAPSHTKNPCPFQPPTHPHIGQAQTAVSPLAVRNSKRTRNPSPHARVPFPHIPPHRAAINARPMAIGLASQEPSLALHALFFVGVEHTALAQSVCLDAFFPTSAHK